MKLLLSAILILVSQNIFSSEDLGSLNGADFMSLSEERVHNIVASSAEIRRSLEVGRDLAGVSPEEQKWAQEFESLMDSEEEVDYLKLASEL